MKNAYKKIIHFALFPFESNKLVFYFFALRILRFLGVHSLYQKLLWQLEVDENKFVKICIKIPHSRRKYLYVTNRGDDLRYLCKSDFGEWEFVSRHFFSSIASECDLILDIGAYSGVYTVETAILNPNSTIHSFEPNSEIFRNLRKNIEVNKLENR